MIKWKHKKKILAGLKRDRLSGAFDRLSCSKKGKRRMEKLIYKSKYENQFTNKHRKNCKCCPGHSLTVSQLSKSLSL